MTMVAGYLATLVTFTAIDLLWLGVVAKPLYRSALAGLLAERFEIIPAVAFYLLYAAGVMVFAIVPALRGGGWSDAALSGALLGLLCYATYDLTNLATLKGWPLGLSLIDMGWGTVLTATAATIGWHAMRAVG